ncbi:MAG: hypothetical protein VX899_15165 [Myxococcota bacterium]|nr:hypothetical protein [Myxococcota bacterium]
MTKKATHPAYEDLLGRLEAGGVALDRGKLFGMPCVKSAGKAVIGAFDGAVVFKLAGQAHADALALPGSRLFDPSGKGRPMKAWVVVEEAGAWDGLAQAALAGSTTGA